MTAHVDRIAAFSDGALGGNPAGVVIADQMPAEEEMQRIAAEVGYSETAFAAPEGAGWRVRYFAPVGEVAFCGHATIALGATLAGRFGAGTYALQLNDAGISVEGQRHGDRVHAALISPPTRSGAVDLEVLEAALALFGLDESDLDPTLPAAVANAGNDHLVLALRDRARLATMEYDLNRGAAYMRLNGFTTINLLWVETPQRFHSRNAFAIGGVLEDPATGAAAAALAGYLRDIGWPHGGTIDIVQGEDMGARSLLRVEIGDTPGQGVRVSGSARQIG
ncbi:PhzF family phenazine biosynthesis protein [Ruegeria pomeroyi]|nr:PhzF family phenazine biosynthesis protein [Ruegeria pomeroyi]MCE8516683.1 PhzF family phenazine biosynthesis protein [Ruegeria pomeroyi]MCE8531108.1 PhzF family phenazine biosynthesis protein [Ruegeria pomeroyi]MCE8548223.1 PhzF family phenazine biosynthesis protein [Ruegeria pomeroyi]